MLIELHYNNNVTGGERRISLETSWILGILEDDKGNAVVHYALSETGSEQDDDQKSIAGTSIGGSVWRRLSTSYDEAVRLYKEAGARR